MRIERLDFYELPLGMPQEGKDIVIYGAGTVGQQYIVQLLSGGGQLRYVVDKRFQMLKELDVGFEVSSPDVLNELKKKDVIIVLANKNKTEATHIKQSLIDMGFCERQIVYNLKYKKIEVPAQSMKKTWNSCYSTWQARKVFGSELDILKELDDVLEVETPIGIDLVRVGNVNDGGYILMDSFEGSAGIVYSFGISNDVSFDKELAERGYDIYQYDHTIDGLPEENEKFHYFKKGITGKSDNKDEMLDSLENIIRTNRHEDKEKMILKMDVEGAEYEVIKNTPCSVFEQFSQMTFEFHIWFDKNWGRDLYDAICKLKETHSIVHIHANNCGGVRWIDGVPYCEAYEITLASKKYYSFEKNVDLELPIEIDNPCKPDENEIVLGKWNHRKFRK